MAKQQAAKGKGPKQAAARKTKAKTKAKTTIPARLANALKKPGSVTALELRRLKLKELPPEIGALRKLRQLDVQQNSLRTLPDEIGALTALRDLNLRGSSTIRSSLKALPPSFAQLKRLEKLDLAYNMFRVWPTALDSLRNLKELNLRGNKLPSLGVGIGQLKKLEVLHLSYNKLTDLPPGISGLSKLRELSLSGMNGARLRAFEATLDRLQPLRKLSSLELVSCGLRRIPVAVTRLRSLETINLRHNSIRTVPDELAQMESLRRILVRRTDLSAEAKKRIRELLPECQIVIYRG